MFDKKESTEKLASYRESVSWRSHLPHGFSISLIMAVVLLFGLGAWVGYALSPNTADDQTMSYQAGYNDAMQEAHDRLLEQGWIMEPVPGEVPTTDVSGTIKEHTDTTLTLVVPPTNPLADPQVMTFTLTSATQIREVIEDLDDMGEVTPEGEWIPPEPIVNILTPAALEESMFVTVTPTEASAQSSENVAESVTFTTAVVPEDITETPEPLEEDELVDE